MAVNPFYPNLFKPGQIGKVKIRNRIVMGPTERHFHSAFGEVTSKTIDYYVERAKGGFGLMLVGCCDVGLDERNMGFLSFGEHRFLPGHAELTEAVHAYGAKIGAQLVAVGRSVPAQVSGGRQPVSASAIPAVMVGEITYPTPRALTRGEIYQIIDKYGMAAERARSCGYDMVELHACHGMLLSSFLSPFMNKRTDEFGGSLENRVRFIAGVIRRIRELAGGDYPVSVRISGDEFVEGGITTKESPLMSKMLEEAGAAVIHASAGIYESYWKCNDVMRLPEGWKAYIWEAIKKEVTIPVIGTGNLRGPELSEKALAEGKTDFVGLSRGAIADPYWVKKAAEGRPEDICRCISCLECHLGVGGMPRQGHWHARCALNPVTGRERDFAELKPAAAKKKVMVVGGGPGGMEAARIAALRGHKVTLYEKSPGLGGQLPLASKAPGKDKIDWFNDYLKTQVKKARVEVKLNTAVTPETVQAEKPDAVIIATGSEPVIPGLPGAAGKRVVTARDVLAGKAEIKNQKVVVAGGGLIGCETAEFLAERGNQVTVIEMLPTMASDMELLHRKALMDSLKAKNVAMLTERRMLEVKPEGLLVLNLQSDEKELLKADWVVLALGAKPVRALVEALDGKVAELYVIGDCEEARSIKEAVYEGSLIARRL